MARTGIGADFGKLVTEKLPGDCAGHGGEGITDCVLMPGPGRNRDGTEQVNVLLASL